LFLPLNKNFLKLVWFCSYFDEDSHEEYFLHPYRVNEIVFTHKLSIYIFFKKMCKWKIHRVTYLRSTAKE